MVMLKFQSQDSLLITFSMRKILVSGAYGQLGQELFIGLAKRYGAQNIVCTDLKNPPKGMGVIHHEIVDVLNKDHFFEVLKKHQITDLYGLASLLSATGELYPLHTDKINMGALLNYLESARLGLVNRVFWPSSIAAFGANTPKVSPQHTVQEPTTVYGICKKAGELWCNYYFTRYGVDVRSVRYPGLIGWRSNPGGGTTDYAPQLLQAAVMKERYTCYLTKDTPLSMMYMDDAVDATIKLMDADPKNLSIRTSYNIRAMEFTPYQITSQVRKHFPDVEVEYIPEKVRQYIAETWPQVFIDDKAREDWGFSPKFGLPEMVADIFKHLTPDVVRSLRPSQQIERPSKQINQPSQQIASPATA